MEIDLKEFFSEEHLTQEQIDKMNLEVKEATERASKEADEMIARMNKNIQDYVERMTKK